MTIAEIAKGLTKVVSDNSPAILTSLGVIGVVSTTVLAVQATPQAVRILDHDDIRRRKNNVITKRKVTETIALTWKGYIPATVMGGLTIACVICAHSINAKRNAALIGMYTLAESSFAKYKDKVVETIGGAKEELVRAEVAKEYMEANPVSTRDIIITGNGEVLCYDTLSGRYFQSSMEALRKAQNDINGTIINDMYASQNDFYRLLNLKTNGYGDEFGWNTDVMLDLEFATALTEDGRPCLSVGYRTTPIMGYHKFGG